MQFFVDAAQISALSLTMAYASAQTYRPVFTASGFASFLEEESLGETFNSPIITLTNFLNYLCETDESISPILINRFYNRALLFKEWQENFESLHIATSVALRNFCDATGFNFSFSDVIEPGQLQVIPLNHKKVKERLMEKFLESELSISDQYRLFEDRSGRIVAILRLQNKSIRAITFPDLGALIDGEVVPLCTDFALSYGATLELEPGITQNLQLNSQAHARFRVTGNFIDGAIVRGFNFEPVKILKGTTLIKEAELFYPVKHLEHFFIDRNSDVVYLELISSLSRAIDLVLAHEPEAVPFALEVLQRSRFAWEQIFPDDKPLQVQVQSLERALSVESVWTPSQSPTNLQIKFD
jgi:hypothetical protein